MLPFVLANFEDRYDTRVVELILIRQKLGRSDWGCSAAADRSLTTSHTTTAPAMIPVTTRCAKDRESQDQILPQIFDEYRSNE